MSSLVLIASVASATSCRRASESTALVRVTMLSRNASKVRCSEVLMLRGATGGTCDGDEDIDDMGAVPKCDVEGNA